MREVEGSTPTSPFSLSGLGVNRRTEGNQSITIYSAVHSVHLADIIILRLGFRLGLRFFHRCRFGMVQCIMAPNGAAQCCSAARHIAAPHSAVRQQRGLDPVCGFESYWKLRVNYI